MDNQYDSMTLASLRALAKELGMKNITSYKKSELIEAIKKLEPEVKKDVVSETEAKVDGLSSENSDQHLDNKVKTEQANKESKRKKTQAELAQDSVKEKKAQADAVQAAGEKMQKETEVEAKAVAEMPQAVEKEKMTQAEPVQEMSNKKAQPEPVQMAAKEKKTQPEPVQMAVKEKKAQPEQVQNSVKEKKASAEPAFDTVQGKKTVADTAQAVTGDEKVLPETVQGAGKEDKTQSDSSQIVVKEERKGTPLGNSELELLDSGETKEGILEVLPDGYGFIRCDNYLPGENDVYVSPAQIRRFNLKTGDIVTGNTKIRSQNEKFSALLYIKSVNGFPPTEAQKRKKFEDLTPVFPNQRIHLETPNGGVSMRMVDLISPIGKGQRGMIDSQPKTGKTTLLKQIAKSVTKNHPEMWLIILLIDERPEEVTDIKESIEGKNVEVIYSTFDELPENHKRVSEMVIERAKRLVEHKQDVMILLDSITRLARAYNLTVQPSGRTLSGGLDPAALHMPKKFFGAARNMREGGSLTILATALVDTGSRMDDVVFEEFKGTGNMELVLDRSLSEKRIFPAIDLPRSSTRREDLLLTQQELEATYIMRKALSGMKSDEALERIIDMFLRTKSNAEFIEIIKKTKIV